MRTYRVNMTGQARFYTRVFLIAIACTLCVIIILDRLTVTRKQPIASSLKSNLPAATRKVIILTYMRSGSSFTGDIIQQHPDVFYVFEPLMTIGKQFDGLMKENMIYYFDNTSITANWIGEGKPPLYIKTMQSVFNCRFDQLDNGTLKQDHMRRSKTTNEAAMCIRENSVITSDWQKLVRCFKVVNSKCQSSKIIATKSIRFSMRQAEVLLSSDPTVKVIHLIRDPRGVLNSREKFRGSPSKTPVTVQAMRLCSQVLEDIETSKTISKKWPSRILTVRYEDIAESPLVAARQLYRFLDLDMRPEIERYIWNNTYAGIVTRYNVLGVKKSNSTETAYAWRHQIDYKSMIAIQESCLQVFHKIGYRVFESKDELTNSTIISKYRKYDPELMNMLL